MPAFPGLNLRIGACRMTHGAIRDLSAFQHDPGKDGFTPQFP
jgi:hypothetical protein